MLALLFLLQLAGADITTRLASHYSKVVKMKCDALPYRTFYNEPTCYFVIEAESDLSNTGAKCASILAGAQLCTDAPDKVYDTLFVEKSDFLLTDRDTGKRKAMCIHKTENPLPCSTASDSSKATGTCSKRAEESFKERKITYRMGTPFRDVFTKPVEIGQTIVVKGTFMSNVDQFVINLMKPDFQTIALHFNPRFQKNQIVLNTFVHGNWQTEQLQRAPFQRGDNFDIRIRILADRFQILVDHKVYCEYAYRLPLNTITHIYIDGAAAIHYVHLGESYLPVPYDIGVASTFPVCQHSCAEVICQSLHVSGVPSGADRIAIDIHRRNGDIALHFNPRYDKGHTVLNSFKNGNWLNEEFVGALPMPRNGQRFNLTITNEVRGWQIVANGKHFGTFRHRTCPFDMTDIWFWGFFDLFVSIH